MELQAARELLKSPIWGKVRDSFLESGEFKVYPRGDLRRLEYLDPETRQAINLWIDALSQAEGWKKVVSGEEVRALKVKYAGVYPEVMRYTAYFTRFHEVNDEYRKTLLKLKFPEAYELCFC